MDQLYKIIDKVDIDKLAAVDRIRQEVDRLKKMVSSLSGHAATAKVAEIVPDIDVYACARYILKEGTIDEKRNILLSIKSNLLVQNKKLLVQEYK